MFYDNYYDMCPWKYVFNYNNLLELNKFTKIILLLKYVTW